MRDIDVRNALRREVLKRHEGEPDTLVLHELGLRHGVARVDVAVVNGSLHGYEIKSDSDTLDRLPAQIEIYGLVLDRATLVVGQRHADKAMDIVPPWWGVKIATEGPRGGIQLRDKRRPRMNANIDPLAVAELLWSTEAKEVLRDLEYSEKDLRKPRAYLYRELARVMPLDELRDTVRAMLKSREKWRGQPQPA